VKKLKGPIGVIAYLPGEAFSNRAFNSNNSQFQQLGKLNYHRIDIWDSQYWNIDTTKWNVAMRNLPFREYTSRKAIAKL
jgi:hypothetical protein